MASPDPLPQWDVTYQSVTVRPVFEPPVVRLHVRRATTIPARVTYGITRGQYYESSDTSVYKQISTRRVNRWTAEDV
jgi:hypothetical protein